MKSKKIIKRIIDLLMILLLFNAMAYMVTGQEFHEWNGAALCLLFLVHNLLNINWYKSLRKGKYPLPRLVQTVLNILLFACVISLFASGVMMSGYVFAWMPIHGKMSFARNLHMVSAYWGFVLMSMHLGLHWGMMMNLIKKADGMENASKIKKFILWGLAGITAIYGAYAFVKNDILSYMLLKNQFVFFDFEQPVMLFFWEYIAMMGLWTLVSFYGFRWIKSRKTKVALQSEKEVRQ